MNQPNDVLDLAVVGAGPCGIAVGAAAKKAGLSCTLFDKGAVTSSLLHYPYYMTFFSTAVMLEVGDVPFTIPDSKPTRREAIAYYRHVVRHFLRQDLETAVLARPRLKAVRRLCLCSLRNA